MKDLITIIINVYNGEKFIKKCLDCVVNQTYKKLEILVINDGSTDKTIDIINTYNDKRIRVITTENKGLSLSRNVGIDNAKGEYLYFIDVDDFIELDTIEYLYNLCIKNDVKMSTCRPIDIYDYNVIVKKEKEKIEIISSEEMLKKIFLAIDRSVCMWNKLMHKSLFDNIRLENRIMNDVAVTYKIIIKSNNIAYSNQIKYYYLRHRNAITARKIGNIKRSIDNYNASVDRYNYIKKIYPYLKENDVGMISIIIMLYLRENEKLDNYLNENGAMKFYKDLFSFKLFTLGINFKEKIKILLFMISPKLCKLVNRKYQSCNYKYKM